MGYGFEYSFGALLNPIAYFQSPIVMQLCCMFLEDVYEII